MILCPKCGSLVEEHKPQIELSDQEAYEYGTPKHIIYTLVTTAPIPGINPFEPYCRHMVSMQLDKSYVKKLADLLREHTEDGEFEGLKRYLGYIIEPKP
jgi:hypothetical protein